MGTHLVHAQPGVSRAAVRHDAVVAGQGEREGAGKGVSVKRSNRRNWTE